MPPKPIEYPKKYDVIVVGAGHAGCEAALASARLGCETLLLTINADTIAMMSCNPAMGGPAKSQLIREVDALGGEIGLATDLTYLQMKTLNSSKGPAVQALRAQSDRIHYHINMKKVLENQPHLDIKQALVEEILTDRAGNRGAKVTGIKTSLDVIYRGKNVVITTGTFLKGLIHIGLKTQSAGRAGEFSAEKLSDSLRKLGLRIGRLKTGTTPRLNRNTIDFSKTQVQPGDEPPKFFSFEWEYSNSRPENAKLPQIPCYLTWTNERTHKIIRANLDRSPLFTGVIKGVGPRYCPSIEDKVVRFPEKHAHQTFLEPQGRDTLEIYTQGMSTSLPEDVQLKFLRTMRGLEEVEVIRPGYAIEYDFVYPEQLQYTLETKKIGGLFLAGQINGTSGYEEAAAQGIVAGINAAQKTLKAKPLILGRADSYIGTLIDDLITKEIAEPYRMLTSRSEYRLLLRQDNADLRLTEKGYRVGLISRKRFSAFKRKRELVAHAINLVKKGATEKELRKKALGFPGPVIDQALVEIKYAGYIDRQLREIDRFQHLENVKLPADADFTQWRGLSREAQQKLNHLRPVSLGQASRIAGVSPADISVLLVQLQLQKGKKTPPAKTKVL